MAYPMIWTTLNVSITLGCVWLIVGALPTENLFLALGVFGLTLSGIFGLGCCLAALTLLLKETAQIIANLFQFVLLFLCAIVVPFQILPAGILVFSRLIPLSYSVDLFRSALLGFPPGFPELADQRIELLVVLLWAVCMPVIGYFAYQRAERHVRIHGTLAEF
jgi:ABC-type polysaccharide/polyol phosphate export permease